MSRNRCWKSFVQNFPSCSSSIIISPKSVKGTNSADRGPIIISISPRFARSGKTEVYMEMIEEVLQKGKQVIVLIPEIALTLQTVHRLGERFGERVSLLHSRLSEGERYDQYGIFPSFIKSYGFRYFFCLETDRIPAFTIPSMTGFVIPYFSLLHSRLSEGERYDQYERAKRGEIDIIIGPRSALFVPFTDSALHDFCEPSWRLHNENIVTHNRSFECRPVAGPAGLARAGRW